jgi:hypothetical protein
MAGASSIFDAAIGSIVFVLAKRTVVMPSAMTARVSHGIQKQRCANAQREKGNQQFDDHGPVNLSLGVQDPGLWGHWNFVNKSHHFLRGARQNHHAISIISGCKSGKNLALRRIFQHHAREA